MDALAIIAVIGGIALFAGLFNGITAQQLTIHALPVPIRLISSIVGVILISAVLYRVYSFSSATTAQDIPTPIATSIHIPAEPTSNVTAIPTSAPRPTQPLPDPTSPPAPAPTPIVEPTATTSPNRTALTPDEVKAWCQGSACHAERFEQLEEANGFINPLGVKMKTGDPVSFDIPQGVTVDAWDCFNASRVTGPIHLSQVCEASFRRDQ